MNIFPCQRSFAPENLVSRDGSGASPVPRQPAHLHTKAESGAYLRDSSRVPSRRSIKNANPARETEELIEACLSDGDYMVINVCVVQVGILCDGLTIYLKPRLDYGMQWYART